MQFIQFQSQDPNSLNTPSAGSFNIFIDETDNTLKVKDQAGDVYGGGGGFSDTTYSELVSMITTSGLTAGGFYLITNFRTCYDQPDFDYNANSITTGNYKQSAIQPIMVFATSVSTISVDAYQPAYPKDKIQYDWTYSATEVTNGVAYGRISERIDEFNNRTDYDHRTILFKRYRLYTHRPDQRLNGTIELLNDGTVNGTNTSFTALTVGDVIYVPGVDPSFYEITGITDNFEMFVSGDTIASSMGGGLAFYKAIEETNGNNNYFSFKRTNVKTNGFIEYTTFGNAISESFAKNNYVGNYANNYTNISSGTFILANNVFLEGAYESNTYGDSCYDNTFGTDNQNNTWGSHCHRNVSTNDIDDNIFGHFFYNNLINANLQSNIIGDNFNNNRLLCENGPDFGDNTIGNNFNNNVIYSSFYRNEILHGFNSNTIGDFGNLTDFEFYRNYIRNNFNSNIIRRDFQNNQIGTNFQNNIINGEFIGNTILNGYNNNEIGDYFALNQIGNGFNNNLVYDNFYENTTGYYFNNNYISNEFSRNNIGSSFVDNNPINKSLFDWGNTSIENLTGRTYDTFYDSSGGNYNNNILGKELIMHDTNNDVYYKVKFTQWTPDGNGGGFSYERTEVWPTAGNTVYFTKTDNGPEVDIIAEGSLEITRGQSGAIYNQVDEVDWNSSQSPLGTQWNSIYTEPNNGRNFQSNKIGDDFYNNTIGNNFGLDINNNRNSNIIGDNFNNNTIGNYFNANNISNRFQYNDVGENFENNTIKNYFIGNTILDGFESNEIGDYFGNDGNTGGSPIQNTIFNDFKFNKIGNFFGNDTNFPAVGDGTNSDGGNIINDGFQFNFIGDNFMFNTIDLNFTNNKIGNNFWFNIFGQNASDNIIGNLFVGNSGIDGSPNSIGNNFISNNLGNYSGFNEIDSDFQYNKIGNFFGNSGSGTQNIISDGFKNNSIGNYFGDDGSQTDGGNVINYPFYDNLIGNKFYSNTVDAKFFRNDIGNEFFGNTINNGGDPNDNVFHNNEIGNRFNGNTTASYFYGNIIGGGFNNNTVGSNFYSNEIGFGYNNNTVGDSFYSNFVGYYFNQNSIGNNFYDNTISSYFESNITSTDFRYNNVKLSSLSSIDFSTSTHVYGGYNCELFARQDGAARLSYYDNSDVLNITDIDA